MQPLSWRSFWIFETGLALLLVLNFCFCAHAEVSNFSGGALPYVKEFVERPSLAEALAALPPLNKPPTPTAKEKEQGFIVWWPDYSVHMFEENPPAKRGEPECITPKDEFEPLLIGLWGLRDVGEVTLRGVGALDRIMMGTEPPGCRIPSEVRVVNWRRRYSPIGWEKDGGGREVGIPIYLTKDITVNVTEGHNSIFWVTFKAGDRPGTYQARMELLVRETGRRIPLRAEVEVVDLDVPPADIAFGNFTPIAEGVREIGKERGGALMTEARMRTYLKDMADHGQTSIVFFDITHGVKSQKWYLPEEGRVDWDTKNGRLLKYAKECGLFVDGVPWVTTDPPATSEGRKLMAEEVKAHGLPPVLAYGPTDEPRIWEAKSAVSGYKEHFARVSQEYMPDITATFDGYSASLFGFWTPYYWMPAIGTVSRETEMWAEAMGAEIWVYDCNGQDFANPPQSRYNAGLYMWGQQLKGNMIWGYTHGPTCSFEEGKKRGILTSVFRGFEQVALSHQYGIIPTIRWEGRREGIEDYRLLTMLEKIAPEGSEAASWLADLRNRVDWYLLRNAVPIAARADLPLYAYTGDFEPQEFREIRKQAMQYLQEYK